MSSMFGARIISMIPMIYKQKEDKRQINKHPERNRTHKTNRTHSRGTVVEQTRRNSFKTVYKINGMSRLRHVSLKCLSIAVS